MTRIIAGVAGGRRLAVPANARPTTDRVREALFNVLAARVDLDGMRVLDLFAGSGALGLEALSRGAASVLMVDNDRRAAEVMARNISAVGLPGATVRRGPVAAVLAARVTDPVDLVLADPPYDLPVGDVQNVLSALSLNGWLRPGGVVVVERPASAPELVWPASWPVWPVRRYGDTRLEAAESGTGTSPGSC